MAKQIIRLTESDLHKIIRESVKRIIKEEGETYGDWRDDYEKWRNHIGNNDDGNELLKNYIGRAKSEFGGDESARISALNKHMAQKDSEREQRLSKTDPDFLNWEKAWSRKYDAENGINNNVDADTFDFEAEKAKAAEQRGRRRTKKPLPNTAKQTPSKFSGKSEEELEQLMKDMGFAK